MELRKTGKLTGATHPASTSRFNARLRAGHMKSLPNWRSFSQCTSEITLPKVVTISQGKMSALCFKSVFPSLCFPLLSQPDMMALFIDGHRILREPSSCTFC